jgi:hypothetical protein
MCCQSSLASGSHSNRAVRHASESSDGEAQRLGWRDGVDALAPDLDGLGTEGVAARAAAFGSEHCKQGKRSDWNLFNRCPAVKPS